MITYLLIGVIVLILLIVVLWFLNRPPRFRRSVNDDLSRFFKTLLYSNYETSFLVIEAPNKHRFVQFARYQQGRKAGMQFDFPLAPWSEKYYEKLQRTLHDKGIDFETEPTSEKVVLSFITIDFKQDWEGAMEFAKLVLLEVFGMQPNDRIKIYVGK